MSEAPLWTGAEILQATSGSCSSQDWQVTGVSIDNRAINPGDLFIAIVGPNNDGHTYVKSAFENGAVAALVSRIPEDCEDLECLVLVEDTQTAMEQLGEAARARTDAKIIAVTGSVGKTGTKEALAHCLSAQGKTHWSVSSFNNHWGVPLSLARMPQETEFGVFEVGMNHPGELGPLSCFVKPHAAIITTIAIAHLEFFKDKAEIARAKSEIFEGVLSDGTAVINADIEEFQLLHDRALEEGVRNILTFGSNEGSDCKLLNMKLVAHGSEVEASIAGERVAYQLSVPGEHWVKNSLAVLGAIKAVGADVQKAASSLASFQAPGGRGEQLNIQLGSGSFTIIDESYNASPIAMRAAFKVLKGIQPIEGGRRIAVIGDMRELGEKSAEIHADLVNDLLDCAPDMVYACGPYMQNLYEGLPQTVQGGYAASSSELAETVRSEVRAGDIVLVKGSLGTKMKLILDALIALSDDQSTLVGGGA
ncbi:UDP-N-acetylmuramoylalanyl-D-glutamyl-2,6-diaminopimelate--D-alanyl-D-alanine ligase [Sneathiella limimaris]|uniref:UDP-N-acetylmuramoylalanyl-D-glutamyl-2, 6-diaminopimelate--D-alanyl-D-alanine ligase n=1 Tax=Sneathiella limimaris TaxID=1964213 RepID=UPI00146E982C|nr:UDP-N-acetylmuramoylalanyl-D-glutamyl-2,6-diaminopimelate--D-alanyl-D-alanine ligase [Sneathiella limimaris]